jgi:hypothetical protein
MRASVAPNAVAPEPMPCRTVSVGSAPSPLASYAWSVARGVCTVRLAKPRRFRAKRPARSTSGSKRDFMARARS